MLGKEYRLPSFACITLSHQTQDIKYDFKSAIVIGKLYWINQRKCPHLGIILLTQLST